MIPKISRRYMRIFKSNKRAYASCILLVFSLFAPIIAHDKPLIVSYKGQWHFPMLQFVSDEELGGNLPTEADFKDSFTVNEINKNGWMIMPIIEWYYDTVDYFSNEPVPSGPSTKHWLGTDDQGRDVLARLIYAIRLGLIFGFILTALSSVIGVFVGAIQGYFGGRTDLFIGRFGNLGVFTAIIYFNYYFQLNRTQFLVHFIDFIVVQLDLVDRCRTRRIFTYTWP